MAGYLVAGVVVGTGLVISIVVSMGNDFLREEFPELKEFEDNVGEAVVDGWNGLVSASSEVVSYINLFD